MSFLPIAEKTILSTKLVGGHEIVSESLSKYLGIMLDVKLRFKGHLDYAREKAMKVCLFIAL